MGENDLGYYIFKLILLSHSFKNLKIVELKGSFESELIFLDTKILRSTKLFYLIISLFR